MTSLIFRRLARAGLSAAAGLTVSPVQAQAQGDAVETTALVIGDIVVTGRSQSDAARVLTSVDVLDGSIVQRQSVNNAFELFYRLPGVLTTNFGQGVISGQLSWRGFNAEGGINAVKLLIDGIPSNDNAGYTPFLDFVFPLNVASIEVVRGTSDARYGLFNIAGNAEIRTRSGGNGLDAQAIVGSFGTYDGQVAYARELGGLSQNYFAAFRHTDGQRDHARLERGTASAKLFYDLCGYRVGAIGRYYKGVGQEPGFLSLDDARERPNTSYPLSDSDGDRRELIQAGVQGDGRLADELTNRTTFYFNRFNDSRFVRFAASIPQFERQTRQNQYGGLTSLRYEPAALASMRASLEVGAEFQLQQNRFQQFNVDSRVRLLQRIGQRFDLQNYAAYVQAVIYPVDWLRIVPAYRVDRFDGSFENRLTGLRSPVVRYGTIGQPKISAAATLSKAILLYGNYGRTFQAGQGATTYRVPPQTTNFSPSYNDGVEAGMKFKAADWLEGRVAFWRQTASNEITFDQLSLQQTNLGKTRRQGYDIQVNARASSQLNAWFALSSQRGEIRIGNPANPAARRGNAIDHVPKYVYSGGVEYRPTRALRLEFTANGQSRYYLDTTNTTGRIGDFVYLNFQADYALSPRIELGVQVRNLANDRALYGFSDGSEALIAPADGRAAYASLRARF